MRSGAFAHAQTEHQHKEMTQRFRAGMRVIHAGVVENLTVIRKCINAGLPLVTSAISSTAALLLFSLQ